METKVNTFFTSDTHFGHTNIIRYSKRPYKDVREMDEALIKNWNDKIAPHDHVYHLGDFSFSNAEPIYLRLNGIKHFIKGNHDQPLSTFFMCTGLRLPRDVMEVKVNGQAIFMSHYAHRVWPKSHHGTWHLYGHSHGSLPDDPNSLSFDCGVDCHNYAPLSFDEVKAIMAKKTYKPVDHHGSRS